MENQEKKPKTSLTFEERKSIQYFLNLGYSCSAIAKKLDRGKNTIVVEVRRNNGHLYYNASEAQKRSNDLMKKKHETLSIEQTQKEKHPMYRMKQKIENLEMQVEILHETLKELMKNDSKN